MKMRTTWNLELMYKSANDPQIERDMQNIEKLCDAFARKWAKNQSFINDTKTLLKALREYEVLEDNLAGKPMVYFYLARDIDTNNDSYTAALTKISDRLTKAHNKLIFFVLKLGNIEKKLQKQILVDASFKHFHYFLRKIFENAQYNLSEAEEKIMSLKSQPAYQLWVDANEKALRKLTVEWKGEKLPIHKASGILPTLPRPQRAQMDKLITEQYKSIGLIAEAEMNAVMIDKKINDELRGFNQPYSATVLEYQNTEAEVMQLVERVSKAYGISARFYRLKAKLMGLSKLAPYDTAVELQGSKQKFSFEDAVEIVRTAFAKVDQQYADILDRYIANGQIDVYAKVGKAGGGYCWTGHGRPTYILLNWADNLRSVTTLAHEMGHAIHGELSKKGQGALYEGHPISTAEVASTLFENFAFEELMSRLSERDQLFARFNKIQEAISTIFRQIAVFQNEQDIHSKVRTDGHITAEEMTTLRRKHLGRYMGPGVVFTKNDGWGWVAHSHIRCYFYVYSYAYGHLISTAMYAKYKKDPKFVKGINSFLLAGESASPLDIFKSIGIDTSKESFWIAGLKSIEDDIKQLEKMAKNMVKKK